MTTPLQETVAVLVGKVLDFHQKPWQPLVKPAMVPVGHLIGHSEVVTKEEAEAEAAVEGLIWEAASQTWVLRM